MTRSARPLQLGLRQNLAQFSLLVAVNALVGGIPDAADGHHLARVTTGRGSPYARRDDLVAAMATRRTNRTAYHGDPMDAHLRATLEEAAGSFGVRITWVDAADIRTSLVDLIMTSDREQMKSKDFRHELSHWMRPEHSHRDDGMEADLLGENGIAAYVAPLIVRTFDVGKMQAATDEKLTQGSPDIAVVSTASDDDVAWLATGRALAHVVLRAKAADRYYAYMNQPCEVPASRVQLAELIGHEHPQLVVRFGLADPVHAALRRPVAEVVR